MIPRSALLFLLISSLLGSCVSVKKLDHKQAVLRDPEKLRADVSFIQNKLQKLHPCLDNYTSMKELDFKFDSLKLSITTPMTSNEFFFRLSPVIAAIRQGHTRISPINKKLSVKHEINPGMPGTLQLFQYDFEMFDNRFYITKNIGGNKDIKPLSELVSINNHKPQEILSKYRNTLTSDGFNQTFIERRLCKDLPSYLYYEDGLADSVVCELKYQDTLKRVCLRRDAKYVVPKVAKAHGQRVQERVARRKENLKREEQGYNEISRTYSKNLSFIEPDSSIAILKINDFSDGNHQKFYLETFRLLDTLKTKTLILDIRDNPGGELRDAADLFSYLTDTSFVFIDKSEVASKGSLFYANFFKGNPLIINMIISLAYPMEMIIRGVQVLMVSKDADGRYLFRFPESTKSNCKKNHFKGKVYVLINGGTFSTACILASNLKGSKRAFFVGEETGGDYNGTVAGRMATFSLPASRLKVTFGLAHVQPCYKTGMNGHGIFPDVRIKPTLEDRKRGVDAEMEYVLNKGR